MRVVSEYTESRAFEEHILAAADAAPAGERLGHEATGDEVRDRKGQRSVRTVEGAGDR